MYKVSWHLNEFSQHQTLLETRLLALEDLAASGHKHSGQYSGISELPCSDRMLEEKIQGRLLEGGAILSKNVEVSYLDGRREWLVSKLEK